VGYPRVILEKRDESVELCNQVFLSTRGSELRVKCRKEVAGDDTEVRFEDIPVSIQDRATGGYLFATPEVRIRTIACLHALGYGICLWAKPSARVEESRFTRFLRDLPEDLIFLQVPLQYYLQHPRDPALLQEDEPRCQRVLVLEFRHPRTVLVSWRGEALEGHDLDAFASFLQSICHFRRDPRDVRLSEVPVVVRADADAEYRCWMRVLVLLSSPRIGIWKIYYARQQGD
jgi:hypothetical protein